MIYLKILSILLLTVWENEPSRKYIYAMVSWLARLEGEASHKSTDRPLFPS